MEQVIIAAFLALFFLEFAIEFALNETNLKYVEACWRKKNIPDFFWGKITSEAYQKSVHYSLAKGMFQRWADPYSRIAKLVVLFSGLLPFLNRLSENWAGLLLPVPYASGVLFCFAVGMVFFLASLPLDLYATFELEARFGFNKTTLALYVADKIKGLFLAVAIGAPFLYVVLWLMEATGRYWWLLAFGFVSAFQLLVMVAYPTLIAPLFNKFDPLEEGELRDRILALARQVGFKTSGIFSMDGSRRSSHSNAYFTGIGRAKRIVLFDTLIGQMTIDEGLAVLAHEMGHYKMKHIRRMLTIQTAFLFLGLFALSLLVDYEPFFSAFGFAGPSNQGALVLFSLISSPFVFYLGPLMNVLSRKHEYEADCFAAATLHDSKPMEEALIKLTIKNLSNLTPHPWYSAYHYSHPTPGERISAIRQCAH
jgi:STE24 endopeptidase